MLYWIIHTLLDRIVMLNYIESLDIVKPLRKYWNFPSGWSRILFHFDE
jgi:hypothetical protein